MENNKYNHWAGEYDRWKKLNKRRTQKTTSQQIGGFEDDDVYRKIDCLTSNFLTFGGIYNYVE